MTDNTAVQSVPTTDNDENLIIAKRRQKLNLDFSYQPKKSRLASILISRF